MASKDDSDIHSGWLPLESNPVLLNGFCEKMGLSAKKAAFHDVYGVDPGLLSFVPQPCVAVVLLFPVTENNVAFKKKQAEAIEEDPSSNKVSENVFYLSQLDGLGNACGTIATIHALANACADDLSKDSPLLAFIESASKLDTADARGKALLHAKGIREVSEKTAASSEASTKCPERTERLHAHFVAFVLRDGDIYELDGRKQCPINHGTSSEKSFLVDTAKVIKEKFMKLDPENMHFNIMALSKNAAA
eukprot:g3241.t1